MFFLELKIEDSVCVCVVMRTVRVLNCFVQQDE